MTEQEQTIEQLRFNSRAVIQHAAEIIAGHSLDDDLTIAGEYLAKSPGTGARSETKLTQPDRLTQEQQAELRAEAAKIGIGAEQSTGLKEAGMSPGTAVIAEGGLPNKMLAQLKMLAENERQPGVILLSASQVRIAGQSDETRMQQVANTLGVEVPDTTGKTEFELAQITANLYPGFSAEQPTTLPFGYELFDGGVTPLAEATGQIQRIGAIGDIPVVILGVQEFHRDDSGKNFYRPSVADLRELAHQVAATVNPETEGKPVATVTSNLYGPSRRLQNPDTLTYGTRVMEEVVGVEAAPASIENIVSELDRTREILQAKQ